MGHTGRMAWYLAQRQDERRGRRTNKVCIRFGEDEHAAVGFMVDALQKATGQTVKVQGLLRYALSAAAEGLALPETRNLPCPATLVQEEAEVD